MKKEQQYTIWFLLLRRGSVPCIADFFNTCHNLDLLFAIDEEEALLPIEIASKNGLNTLTQWLLSKGSPEKRDILS